MSSIISSFLEKTFPQTFGLCNFHRRILSCGILETPRFGRKSNFLFVPGARVTFECNEGFILTGDHRRVCREDGRWDTPEYGYTECLREYYPFHLEFSLNLSLLVPRDISSNNKLDIIIIIIIILKLNYPTHSFRRSILYSSPGMDNNWHCSRSYGTINNVSCMWCLLFPQEAIERRSKLENAITTFPFWFTNNVEKFK